VDEDCQSGYCNPYGICSQPSCDDGWQNQDETGVDCGGPCPPCAEVELPSLVEQPSRALPWLVVVLLSLLLVAAAVTMKMSHPYLSRRLSELVWRFSVKKRREIVRIKAESIRRIALSRINRLEKVLNKGSPEKIVRELVETMRVFFSNLYGLDHRFDYDDLSNALASMENQEAAKVILGYARKILDIEGGYFKFSSIETGVLLKESKYIINLVTEKPESERAIKVKTKSLKSMKKKVAGGGTEKILYIISDAHDRIAEGDFKSAQQLYLQTIGIYNRLKYDEKIKVYDEIKRLYDEIKLHV